MGKQAGQVVKPGTNKSEQNIIKSIGGKSHRNSGRGYVKGDGTWETFVIDVKEASKSFTINQDVWSKICMDAARVDVKKDPALIVVLGGKTRLAVIELEVLEQLVRAD